ncbi:MAG: InlB B-repeat-containing protein, partial [Anaerotignum sp.]|nr:InlB B-repeat-containing protein [Anaerotignum sp.]
MKKMKWISYLIVLAMLMTMIPTMAFAEDETYSITLDASEGIYLKIDGEVVSEDDPEMKTYPPGTKVEICADEGYVLHNIRLYLDDSEDAVPEQILFKDKDGQKYHFEMPEENITIKATAKKVFMVGFDSNGGREVHTQMVESGKRAINPPDPKKEGSIFKGWLLDGEEFDFDEVIAGDIELTAQWEEADPSVVTITTEWKNDRKEHRPNITIHIKTKNAYLIDGLSLNGKMKTLAQGSPVDNPYSITDKRIKAIKWATEEEFEAVEEGLTEVQKKGETVYMWFEEDTGTIFFYSAASDIYMNQNSGRAFCKLLSLEDISALSHFDTSYVTDMNRILQDCESLTDFSPISKWNTQYVTNLDYAFGHSQGGVSMPLKSWDKDFENGEWWKDNTNWKMSANSLEAFRYWDVSNVGNFRQTFKGWYFLETLEPIKDWEVSKATDMYCMFASDISLTDVERTYIEDWDVRCVGYSENSEAFKNMFSYQIYNSPPHPFFPKMIFHPVFKLRKGEYKRYDNHRANYVPDEDPSEPESPETPPEIPELELEYTSDEENCTVTKKGNKWVYKFEVPAGYTWECWEETNDGKLDDKLGTPNAYTESSNGIEGLGGSEENPIKNIKNAATITNTRISEGGDDGPSGLERYTLTYETNGGNKIAKTRHVKNATVNLKAVPTRAGYDFTGWYADADLTNKITSIKMDNHKTVYAGWKEKGENPEKPEEPVVEPEKLGIVTPDALDGDNHFAYVVGYPDGAFRPDRPVTRAET